MITSSWHLKNILKTHVYAVKKVVKKVLNTTGMYYNIEKPYGHNVLFVKCVQSIMLTSNFQKK